MAIELVQRTVVVSIGTGIGRGVRKGEQQSAAEFAAFESEVRDWLQGFGTIYVDGARAFGTDEAGQPEGSSTFVAGVDAFEGSGEDLRFEFEILAGLYGQRCIAVTIGDTTFEGPGEE